MRLAPPKLHHWTNARISTKEPDARVPVGKYRLEQAVSLKLLNALKGPFRTYRAWASNNAGLFLLARGRRGVGRLVHPPNVGRSGVGGHTFCQCGVLDVFH